MNVLVFCLHDLFLTSKKSKNALACLIVFVDNDILNGLPIISKMSIQKERKCNINFSKINCIFIIFVKQSLFENQFSKSHEPPAWCLDFVYPQDCWTIYEVLATIVTLRWTIFDMLQISCQFQLESNAFCFDGTAQFKKLFIAWDRIIGAYAFVMNINFETKQIIEKL